MIIVATTTRKSSDVRAKLALKTFQVIKEMAYELVVVYGGSDLEFRSQVNDYCTLLVNDENRGMGASRRLAVANALEVVLRYNQKPVVIWMEPEKLDLVRFFQYITKPVIEGAADLIVPKRSCMNSYPLEQEYAESMGNLAVEYLIGKELDLWFGPRVFNEQSAQIFLDYQGEYGDKWDSIFIPVLRAMAQGLRVKSVSVDYQHPPEQTVEETGNLDFLIKRLDQLQNLIPALKKESEKLGLIK